MIGARDLAFPRLNLLSWYLFMPAARSWSRRCSPAASIPAGLSTSHYRATIRTGHVVLAVHRHVHRRLLLDRHRPQLHRHHPPAARTGPDLVPAADIRVVAVLDRVIMVLATPVLAMTLVLLTFERIFHVGVFDPASAAIRCCSSTCSGSTRIRRSTS